MSEAKKNDAPSAEAMELAGDIEGKFLDLGFTDVALEDVATIIARVRREARAEAFEEASAPILASMAQCKASVERYLGRVPVVEGEPDPNGCDRCDELQKMLNAIRAIDAKERAK